ncbi:hypothetical protein BJ742DRAFT_545119 [Cladochytrium replicatum]|nr:hypothetical protein BJ742DRAFT_545119 [Cladochytrium replicatum]
MDDDDDDDDDGGGGEDPLDTVAAALATHKRISLGALLSLTRSHSVLSFDDLIARQPNCTVSFVAGAPGSEVFRLTPEKVVAKKRSSWLALKRRDANKDTHESEEWVLKVVAFGGQGQPSISDVAKEVVSNSSLNSETIPGFPGFGGIEICMGLYTHEMALASQRSRRRNNDESFGLDQLFCVLFFRDHSQAITTFHFQTAESFVRALMSLLYSLATAEELYEFEHRDIHKHNVLAKAVTDVKPNLYTFGGRSYEMSYDGVSLTIIDLLFSRHLYPSNLNLIMSLDLSDPHTMLRNRMTVRRDYPPGRTSRPHHRPRPPSTPIPMITVEAPPDESSSSSESIPIFTPVNPPPFPADADYLAFRKVSPPRFTPVWVPSSPSPRASLSSSSPPQTPPKLLQDSDPEDLDDPRSFNPRTNVVQILELFRLLRIGADYLWRARDRDVLDGFEGFVERLERAGSIAEAVCDDPFSREYLSVYAREVGASNRWSR